MNKFDLFKNNLDLDYLLSLSTFMQIGVLIVAAAFVFFRIHGSLENYPKQAKETGRF